MPPSKFPSRVMKRKESQSSAPVVIIVNGTEYILSELYRHEQRCRQGNLAGDISAGGSMSRSVHMINPTGIEATAGAWRRRFVAMLKPTLGDPFAALLGFPSIRPRPRRQRPCEDWESNP